MRRPMLVDRSQRLDRRRSRVRDRRSRTFAVVAIFTVRESRPGLELVEDLVRTLQRTCRLDPLRHRRRRQPSPAVAASRAPFAARADSHRPACHVRPPRSILGRGDCRTTAALATSGSGWTSPNTGPDLISMPSNLRYELTRGSAPNIGVRRRHPPPRRARRPRPDTSLNHGYGDEQCRFVAIRSTTSSSSAVVSSVPLAAARHRGAARRG